MFFSRCHDRVYNLDNTSVKVIIEGCHDCVINLNAPILTQFIELINCSRLTLGLFSSIRTMSIDQSKSVNIRIHSMADIANCVVNACSDLSYELDGKRVHVPLERMSVDWAKMEQVVIHRQDGKLIVEKAARLGVYLTTESEVKKLEQQVIRERRAIESALMRMMGLHTHCEGDIPVLA